MPRLFASLAGGTEAAAAALQKAGHAAVLICLRLMLRCRRRGLGQTLAPAPLYGSRSCFQDAKQFAVSMPASGRFHFVAPGRLLFAAGWSLQQHRCQASTTKEAFLETCFLSSSHALDCYKRHIVQADWVIVFGSEGIMVRPLMNIGMIG